MPHYFFDLRDGEAFVQDNEGMDLIDIVEAQIEAAEYLADAVKELSLRVPEAAGHLMVIEVRDLRGAIFRVGFDFSAKMVQTNEITRA